MVRNVFVVSLATVLAVVVNTEYGEFHRLRTVLSGADGIRILLGDLGRAFLERDRSSSAALAIYNP